MRSTASSTSLSGTHGLQALELDAREVELADLRQHLDGDLELDVLALLELLEIDPRLQRGLQARDPRSPWRCSELTACSSASP